MKKIILKLGFVVFVTFGLLFSFSSCAKIIVSAYGVNRTYTFIDQYNIESLAVKYNIPLGDWYELDTLYFDFIKSYDEENHFRSKRNHTQPLQALYFDENGNLISFHTNCYAGGFPNLKWNRKGILNTFVPETQAPIDTLVTFNKLLPFLNKTPYTEEIIQSDYDYIVVVFWADFMGRQSKRLIRFIQRNVNLAQNNQRVKIIYVNIDNIAYESARNRQE
jgi:hypothetical protein